MNTSLLVSLFLFGNIEQLMTKKVLFMITSIFKFVCGIISLKVNFVVRLLITLVFRDYPHDNFTFSAMVKRIM